MEIESLFVEIKIVEISVQRMVIDERDFMCKQLTTDQNVVFDA